MAFANLLDGIMTAFGFDEILDNGKGMRSGRIVVPSPFHEDHALETFIQASSG